MKERWGWVNTWDGTVQEVTFHTAEGAIVEMERRISVKGVQKIEEAGFKLALVEVHVKVLMVLSSE